MREAFGDVWEMAGDLVCITTNGQVNKARENVMGAGIAKQARDRYPGVAKVIGASLLTGRFGFLYLGKWRDDNGFFRELAAFPTKMHWREKSSVDLIVRAAVELQAFVELCEFENVLLPRPGCRNGGLDWESEVRPAIAPILDDRITAVVFDGEAR